MEEVIVIYPLNSWRASEEEVPLGICDLPTLSHYINAQHERKYQFMLFKQTPVWSKTIVQCVTSGKKYSWKAVKHKAVNATGTCMKTQQ